MGSKKIIKGKVIQVSDSDIVISKGDDLIAFNPLDNGCRKIMKVHGWRYSWASHNTLYRRLLRAEVTGLYKCFKSDQIAIVKKGLFLCNKENNIFESCFALPRGSKPLNLCFAPSGNIYFGEYYQNMEKESVNIYCSSDDGRSWNEVYTFAAGEINHIHGLFFDKYSNRIWVATGDRENECIIGYTEDEFKTFVEVFRGGQEYRTCQLFFYKDFIVFGTDTQYEQNVIKKFDRKTLEITELQKVQGSVIKGGQVGDVAFISTTVEPSMVNTDKYAHLWVTKDGLHWEEKFKAKKDWLPHIFQFGTFEFPQYYGIEKLERLYFSGRALKGLDGKTTYISLV